MIMATVSKKQGHVLTEVVGLNSTCEKSFVVGSGVNKASAWGRSHCLNLGKELDLFCWHASTHTHTHLVYPHILLTT